MNPLYVAGQASASQKAAIASSYGTLSAQAKSTLPIRQLTDYVEMQHQIEYVGHCTKACEQDASHPYEYTECVEQCRRLEK